MNRNLIFALLGGVAILGVIGAAVLQAVRPDATATFTDHVFGVLQYLVSAAAIVYGLGKVSEKVEQVQKQTNGTLSAKDDEISRLRGVAIAAGVNPHTVTGTTPVFDEVVTPPTEERKEPLID